MSERDPVAVLLRTLDRPVEPRAEFADALRKRLLAELGETNGHRAWRPRLTLPPKPHRRRRALGVALAIALAASALAAVLLSRPAPASALDVIRQAQRQVAALPPFQATVRYDLNPDGAQALIPKGATETMQVDYGDPRHLRTAIVGETPGIPGARAVGSFDVVNGNNAASYDPERKTFQRFRMSPYIRPLGDLAWQGGYPNWERICRGPAAQVLPDAVVAGRDARHIRCTFPGGQPWQLWIDGQTGLLLKLKGQTGGGGDSFVDSVPLTSRRGGFTITRLRFHPSFPAGTFRLAAPSGALDYEARLHSAEAKLPPFRAILTTQVHGHIRIKQQLWWQDTGTWRVNYLAGDSLPGGPGSFEVAAHGRGVRYDARDNNYSNLAPKKANPIADLLPERDPRYPSTCATVGHAHIEGRLAIEHRCPDYRIWVDTRTGLILQERTHGIQIRVLGLHYNPTFGAGTFHFTPPRGSRSAAQQLKKDPYYKTPYYKTALRPGRPAPNWHAHLLEGGNFQITGLRGKPALLVFLPGSCTNSAGSEIACNVFTPLERVYRQSKDKLAIVWVDIEPSPTPAREVIRHNRLTFPVVIDHNSSDRGFGANSAQAWRYPAYPYWVLLDSHGRVTEARLGPQTLAQLRQLVNEAR